MVTRNHSCNTSRERFLIFWQILFEHHGRLAIIFEGRLFSSGIFPRQSSETSRLPLTNHAQPLLANQILPTSPLLVASQQWCSNEKCKNFEFFSSSPPSYSYCINMMVLLAGDQAPVPDLAVLELQGLLLSLPALPVRMRGRALFLPAQVFRSSWGYFRYFEHFGVFWVFLVILDILRSAGRFSPSTTLFYSAEIVSALEYLHSLSVAYRWSWGRWIVTVVTMIIMIMMRLSLLLSTFTPSPLHTGDHKDDDEWLW